MKKKILSLLIILSVIAVQTTGAKSMRELWTTLPDSLLPYVDKNHRLEMVEFLAMGMKGDVDNRLNGKSEMDTLTADFIALRLNEASAMQLKRLPSASGDSVICMVRTFYGPEPESTIAFYDQSWNALHTPSSVATLLGNNALARLIQRPDTMTEARFDSLKLFLMPTLVSARLQPQRNELTLRLSAPIAVRGFKPSLDAIRPEVVLRWNGKEWETAI